MVIQIRGMGGYDQQVVHEKVVAQVRSERQGQGCMSKAKRWRWVTAIKVR